MSTEDERAIEALGDVLRVDRTPTDEQVARFRRQVEAHVVPDLPSRRRPAGWSWLVAAAVVAVVAFGATALIRDRGTVEFDGTMIAPDGAVTADVMVVALGIGRQISLVTDQLEILPTGEFYELWFVAIDDAEGALNRISAGTFHPDKDGRSDITFVAAVDPTLYPILEITAEPGDGSPIPGGPVVLRAEIPPPSS